jgi:hypothetical protein
MGRWLCVFQQRDAGGGIVRYNHPIVIGESSYFPLKALLPLGLGRNTLKPLPLAGFLNPVRLRAPVPIRKNTGKPLSHAGFGGKQIFIKGSKIFCC